MSADAEYLRNELFKYMIDIHFEGLKQLCNELKDPEMFQSVGNILADYFNIIEKDVQVIVSKK